VNDDLTRQRSALLFNARKLKRDRLIQDVWSSDGNSLRTTPDEFITFTDSITQYSAFVNWIPNTQPVRYPVVAGYSPHYMELNTQQRACWIYVLAVYSAFVIWIPNTQSARYSIVAAYSPLHMEFNPQYRVGWIFVYICVFGFCQLNSQYPASSIIRRGWLFAILFSIEYPTPSWLDVLF